MAHLSNNMALLSLLRRRLREKKYENYMKKVLRKYFPGLE